MNSVHRQKLGPGHLEYMSIRAAEHAGVAHFGGLPASLLILAENSLRHDDEAAAVAIARRDKAATIRMRPSRVLMQDSSGIPVLADLAAMRDMAEPPSSVEPLIPVDLVVDHSVEADFHGSPDAAEKNMAKEFDRNAERYAFLRWAESAFRTLRVVPPGAGICHQMNLEMLASVISEKDGLAFPDTVLGTDSHTTMVNALGVLGWGVGGIEALAALLGRPVAMRVPEVVGVRLTGRLHRGVTATDVALHLTKRLREWDVVQKIVEFTGPGLSGLRLPDRATVANMAPEYGATMGFFPIDGETLIYLRQTGRSEDHIALVEAYAHAQNIWRDDAGREFSETLTIDLRDIEACVAGPSRPHQLLGLSQVPQSLPARAPDRSVLGAGSVVIASITSCTNTSNPKAMITAGLVARKARQYGLKPPEWLKATLSPGSRVVSDYLERTGLLHDLSALGFALAGHGCMTCMGNSGPLPDKVEAEIRSRSLAVAAVLSGNRNFEGRIHPSVRLGYLASPPLVVAYALAGTMNINLATEAIGQANDGTNVFLSDLWPDEAAIDALLGTIDRGLWDKRRQTNFDGPPAWRNIPHCRGERFDWQTDSTFLKPPPFASGALAEPQLSSNIVNARILLLLGDDVTTDHISPVSRIPPDGPAGRHLRTLNVSAGDLQSFSARRVNHEVMARGAFANPRLANRIVSGVEGGYTRRYPDGEIVTIHDAATSYSRDGIPVIIVAGRNYGAGSARDWAAKGTRILGVRAVIAESFERIHRANLVAFGVLPLQFMSDEVHERLALTGDEAVTILDLPNGIAIDSTVRALFRGARGTLERRLLVRLETEEEVADIKAGGILSTIRLSEAN